MNGPKKYKVTIRVVDRPPISRVRFTTPFSVDRSKQKTYAVSNDNTTSKPVLNSSASLKVSDEVGDSRVYVNSACCILPTGCVGRTSSKKTECRDKGLQLDKDKSNSEVCECTKLLLKTDTATSLNINKLTRRKAIDQEEFIEQNVDINNIARRENTKAVKALANERAEKVSESSCLSANVGGKYAVNKPINGFPRHLPIVVLNSDELTNMEGARHEETIVAFNGVGNVIEDDLMSSYDALGRKDRPPLNREGSACSSDSIITEIEELTDEETELKDCSNEGNKLSEVYKPYFC